MKVDEFLEYKHGITLSDEKMLIDPTFFVKVMNEYAHHKIEEAQALKAINYSFTGRDYNDALAIAEASKIYQETNDLNQARKRLVKEGWDLFRATKFLKKHLLK